jgi:hypothetical protein
MDRAAPCATWRDPDGSERPRGNASKWATSALLLVLLSGCERGCLTTWLAERGGGGQRPTASGGSTPMSRRSMDLSGTDCSDGLLRCVGGHVEASRATHLPHPCGSTSTREQPACVCPYDPIAICSSGCAEDGLEVIGEATDAGAAQLCRPEMPVARPLLPGEPAPTDICVDEGITCREAIVRTCDGAGQPTRALAHCLYGCQTYIAIDSIDGIRGGHGTRTNPDGAISILCRRDHAERQ